MGHSKLHITSRDNSLLRHVRAVRDGKVAELIYVEGLRLCEEALRSRLQVEAVIYSDELARKDRAAKLIRELAGVAGKAASVSEKLLESISYTHTPQGIVLIAGRPVIGQPEFHARQDANPLLIILHRLNNPVNVGAILRTAEAAGATGVITTDGTADPFSPKALRGAMGAAFRLPIWTGADYGQAVGWCRENGTRTVCADVAATRNYAEIDWRGPAAIVMGAESEGLSPEEIALTDEAIRIPMKGSTESLNVAVAAGILLYEASRHRAS
ncbi:MAG TPA: RNA methyltransferase [Pyrinomonadaceae bacterium]|nr:RNA methyltransferase [Pyrinomonadaceae bacterium]